MKKLVCLILAVALTLGCSSALAADLVVYSARNERLNQIVIPAFEAKTGLTVEVVTGSTGEVLQRVKGEVDQNAVIGDIHWAAGEAMLTANKDLFEVYVSKENEALLPEFQNNGTVPFNAAFAEPNVLIVNTEKLAEAGIKVESYADLLQPQLKDHIIAADPANSSSAFISLLGMLYGMGDGDPMSDAAWTFIDGFLTNLNGKTANSSSQVYNGVANGEYWVGLSYEDPCVELEAAGDKPVKVVYAKEGVVFSAQSVQIVKGAPHMEAAQQFVDFVLSEEIQSAVAAELNLRPLRAGVAVNAKMTPSEEVTRVKNYSEAYVAENKPALVAMYIDHVEMMTE